MTEKRKIGLIVNPVAGVGGKAGLKGSDGEEIQRAAFEKGIRPEAPDKTLRALEALKKISDEVVFCTFEGAMGGDEAKAAGFSVTILGDPACPEKTTGADTEKLARMLLEEGVKLIIFAGGDGTARNICSAVGDKVPVIGIPAGVKIHSGVYAVNPESAGQAALQFIREGGNVREAEVMDLDESLYREGIISPRLYGYMNIPDNRKKMQNVKSRSVSQVAALDYIATDIIQSMDNDTVYIIGAGTTTRNIMILMGLDYTLIGVDAVCGGRLIGRDLDEGGLWELVNSRRCHLVITAIGGQGHIFGRGNQQLSPRVIRKIGKDNITVIATKEKLLSLPDRCMLTDTGDRELDRSLEGYMKVVTGLNERTICAVRA
ncbi:MAG: ATP-NAD kinase family protein [Clostridiales bacterium]|nr:ATP-NAD kinase family protein [Clostridiales bacterium]MDD7035719.1 ATP-NAD kinase family protein [Bacillota bacterium]MDY2920633.1 ATP-NAD kinase family protein [Lentihominibacter sp.]